MGNMKYKTIDGRGGNLFFQFILTTIPIFFPGLDPIEAHTNTVVTWGTLTER